MLVEIKDKHGRIKKIDKKMAALLVRLKKAEFVNDFQGSSDEVNQPKVPVPETKNNQSIDSDDEEDYEDDDGEEMLSTNNISNPAPVIEGETAAKKKRGRPKKQTYETKVMKAEV